jgi:hypothetical protein
MQRFTNKVRQQWQDKLNDGYYLRRMVFANGIEFEMVKDMHSPLFRPLRRVYCSMGESLAKALHNVFGFPMRSGGRYMGNARKFARYSIEVNYKILV